jgi:tetratricopeptide (TPR) repeat protein
MSKLPDDLRQMIDQLCRKGDQFAQIDQLDDALDQYEAAWALLPEPRNQWPAATWILMAAGDVYFEKRDFVTAAETLQESLDYPDGDSNAFILLRLGQSLFEMGDLNSASNALVAAHRSDGDAIFVDEDPKYLAFVKTQQGISRSQSDSGRGTVKRFNKPLP